MQSIIHFVFKALDHDDFGLNQSKNMKLINSKSLGRDTGAHPALADRAGHLYAQKRQDIRLEPGIAF
jgi:hypothetical protein